MSHILVLYYSRHGATQKMAEQIALGVETHEQVEAKIRTVPSLHSQHTEADAEQAAHPFVQTQDLIDASGLILGSPTRFGNISSNLQFFLESTLDIWLSGQLIGKPAGVFTSSDSLHGGQESTLLSMILPLMHHGMLITGLPYNQVALHQTQSGGTPYGASHVSGQNQYNLTQDERDLCLALGKNVAQIAHKLLDTTP
jgi:NAD(P)H dehydrogenase (quinone)